jgi:hypothetical protein
VLSHMRFDRKTSLFGSGPGIINGAAQLFVRFTRRCSDLTLQSRDSPRKLADGESYSARAACLVPCLRGSPGAECDRREAASHINGGHSRQRNPFIQSRRPRPYSTSAAVIG